MLEKENIHLNNRLQQNSYQENDRWARDHFNDENRMLEHQYDSLQTKETKDTREYAEEDKTNSPFTQRLQFGGTINPVSNVISITPEGSLT